MPLLKDAQLQSLVGKLSGAGDPQQLWQPHHTSLSAKMGLGEAEVSISGQVWVFMYWHNVERVCKEK